MYRLSRELSSSTRGDLSLGPDLLKRHPARDDADGANLAVVERDEAEIVGRDKEVEAVEEHLRAKLGALAVGRDRRLNVSSRCFKLRAVRMGGGVRDESLGLGVLFAPNEARPPGLSPDADHASARRGKREDDTGEPETVRERADVDDLFGSQTQEAGVLEPKNRVGREVAAELRYGWSQISREPSWTCLVWFRVLRRTSRRAGARFE